MALVDSRAARVLLTLLLFALGLSLLYLAYHTLMAFLFAILLAYLMNPAVSHVEKWTGSRGIGIAVVYVVVIVLMVGFFVFMGPRLSRQAQRLAEVAPGFIENVGSGQIAAEIGSRHGWSMSTQQTLESALSSHREQLIEVAQRAGLRVAEVAQSAWLLVVVPILAVFFLKDGPTFREMLLGFVPAAAHRKLMQDVVSDLNLMLAQFIRAQLTMVLLSFVAYISFLGIMGMPYALLLSSAGGLMEFIPLVGPLVTAMVILGVAVLSGYSHWAALLIFLVVWRMIVDYVVSPRVMGKTMELHPLAAIFGVLAGGEIAGVLGIYLSIPVMATLRIVWRRWQPYAQKKQSALVRS